MFDSYSVSISAMDHSQPFSSAICLCRTFDQFDTSDSRISFYPSLARAVAYLINRRITAVSQKASLNNLPVMCLNSLPVVFQPIFVF